MTKKERARLDAYTEVLKNKIDMYSKDIERISNQIKTMDKSNATRYRERCERLCMVRGMREAIADVYMALQFDECLAAEVNVLHFNGYQLTNIDKWEGGK